MLKQLPSLAMILNSKFISVSHKLDSGIFQEFRNYCVHLTCKHTCCLGFNVTGINQTKYQPVCKCLVFSKQMLNMKLHVRLKMIPPQLFSEKQYSLVTIECNIQRTGSGKDVVGLDRMALFILPTIHKIVINLRQTFCYGHNILNVK